MALRHAFLFILSVIGRGSSEEHVVAPPPPLGCGTGVEPTYRILCDLESVWGVVLEVVASGGAVTALVLALVLLLQLKTVKEPGRRCGVGPLLLLLAGTVGLFGLSLVFLVGHGQVLCVLRRSLWGALFALCFSCLLVQGLRLRRLARGRSSPAGSSLVGLALALTLVQVVIGAEWLLLTVAREGHGACDYPPLDFALACSYALALLLLGAGLSLGVALCGGRAGSQGRRWRCNGVWLFLSCLSSMLLWAAWLGYYLYGDAADTNAGSDDEEPALAVALVTEGWALLLFHAIPEAHLCLRQTPSQQQQQSGGAQDYYDTSHHPAPLHVREQVYDEETPTNHRPQYAENHAFSIEEHSAALRGGGYHNAHVGVRPPLPFRSHVYQPTEMALLMNGGTIPTAPPNYTGRQLW